MTDFFDGFSIHIEEEKSGDVMACLVELPNVSAFGATPEEALSELKIAWEAMKISYQKRGEALPIPLHKKEYSGQFNIRIDKRVHRALAIEAAQAGITLNALVSQKLVQSVLKLTLPTHANVNN